MTDGKKKALKVVVVGICLVAVVACWRIRAVREYKEMTRGRAHAAVEGTTLSYEQTEDGLVVLLTDAECEHNGVITTQDTPILITDTTDVYGRTIKEVLHNMEPGTAVTAECFYWRNEQDTWNGYPLYEALYVGLENQPHLRYDRVESISFKMADPLYDYGWTSMYRSQIDGLLDSLSALDLREYKTCPKEDVPECWITGRYTIYVYTDTEDDDEYYIAAAEPYLIIGDTAYLLGDGADVFRATHEIEWEFSA